MAQTLDEFVEEVNATIEAFNEEYRVRSVVMGVDKYPLTMEDGNEGLWREFFYSFMDGNGV